MSAAVRAIYHHNDFDWAATAYRIGIYAKNGLVIELFMLIMEVSAQ